MNLLEIKYFSNGGCSIIADFKNNEKTAFLNVNRIESISGEIELRELSISGSILAYKKGDALCIYNIIEMSSGRKYCILRLEANRIIERFNLY